MVIDVHCHAGVSARRVDPAVPRLSFELTGAAATPGLDSYFSPRLMARWRPILRRGFVQRAMGITWDGVAGDAFDAQIDAFNARHMLPQSQNHSPPGVDKLVLLAFDEYHRDDGTPLGPAAAKRGAIGSDLYASNSYVRSICAAHPQRFLLGASIHPYRRDAAALLDELKAAGAVLIKWLPIHQNIRAADPRTIAFLRRAAELRLAMLIHYGGEMTLAAQHPEFERPGELLAVLADLRRAGRMPVTIVAHAATPSTRFGSADGHRMLIKAMRGDFAAAPLYADISALAALGRAHWLTRLARQRDLHRKLVWGTDFPIPVFPIVYALRLGRQAVQLGRIPSWIERDLALKRALGFDEAVFHRAADLLDLP